MDSSIGFPDQRKYKIKIVELGLKVKDVSKAIKCHNTTLSQYINGKLFMPENIKISLDNYFKDLSWLIKGKFYKQTEIAKTIGITESTLYKRRRNKSWTEKEMRIIISMF